MADFDPDGKKLTLKVVYYGPAQSGKTTNLTALHDQLSPQMKGDMMVLDTKGDRTLFFDLLPLGMKTPSGLLLKLKLFTVPGQVAHDSTRKAVLSRADAVIFVADSQLTQHENNQNSFNNLLQNIHQVGLNPSTLPLIIQFNKRDLPDIDTESNIMKTWEGTPWPVFFSSALKGQHVVETLTGTLKRLYDHLDKQDEDFQQLQITKHQFLTGLLGDIASLKEDDK